MKTPCAGKFRPRSPWEEIAALGGSEFSSASDLFGPVHGSNPAGNKKIGRSLLDLSMAASGGEQERKGDHFGSESLVDSTRRADPEAGRSRRECEIKGLEGGAPIWSLAHSKKAGNVR